MAKIVIIGSGIGGSGIGALISNSTTHELTLFEKSNLIGGRCASYKRIDDKGRPWIFDIGCHIFSTCDKGPLGEILKRCGRENMIKWVYTAPKVNMMGVEVTGRKKRRRPRRPRDGQPEKKISAIDYLYHLPYEETFQYDHITLKELFKKLAEKEGLKFNNLLFSMSAYIFFGTSLATTSAGEFIRCFSSNYLNKANGYTIGGTGAIPEAYCNIIQENGGKVINGKKGYVKKIVIENNQIKGVEVGQDNEFFEADLIIANSDIKTTVTKLIGENYFPNDYVQYVKNLKWGGQGCSLKIGLDKKVLDYKMLMYIPKVDLKGRNLNDVEIKDMFYDSDEIPDVIPMLIVPISNMDPNLAPESCQTLHCVAVTKIDGTKNWSAKEEKRWEKTCLNTFLTLWPDLEEHIEIMEFMGPHTLAKTFGKEGAGVGIAQVAGQVSDKRPSMISPIKGLLYCSGDAGGWGIGTELPARSAIELYEVLEKADYKLDKIWS
ncbi:MAG: phytoene desaturase family protein [Promethearchaeota archaeon]